MNDDSQPTQKDAHYFQVSPHRFKWIANLRQTFDDDEMRTHLKESPPHGGIHESLFRSYRILEVAKEYLEKGTPTEVVLEVIHFLESDDLDKTEQQVAWTSSEGPANP